MAFNMNQHPIGIFDSGIGGTSVWRDLQKELPFENTIYLADSKNAPYGDKGKEEIIALCRKNTEWLLDQNCKLIVVACNTATTNAIDILRRQYSIPFIGIEPAIKPAALSTGTKKVGVLATRGTLSSQLFINTSKTHASEIEVIEKEGEGLVRIIESGRYEEEGTKQLLKKYLDPMIKADIDKLVLGCTHYPYLIPLLKEILPEHVSIIDCGEAVARQTRRVLEKYSLFNRLENIGSHQFYINSDIRILERIMTDSPVSVTIERLDF